VPFRATAWPGERGDARELHEKAPDFGERLCGVRCAGEGVMPKARKKTAFVPSVVFGTVVVGVIPACVVSACGGTTLAPADASSDAPSDAILTADVALTCFGPNSPSCPPCCGVAAVAYMGFDASDATDAADDVPTDSPQQDVLLGVAVCGFCDAGDEGGG
jgi:hypothetical protein